MATQYSHIVLNLLGVLSLMVICLFIIKKLKMTKLSNNKFIKVLNMVPVGAKEKILLLEVNNTVMLVGATPTHIETLYVFSEGEANKAVASDTSKEPDFSAHIASIMKKGTT